MFLLSKGGAYHSVILLTARLALYGVSRKEAARRLCLSYSAFNRKLREGRLTKEEIQALDALVKERGGEAA